LLQFSHFALKFNRSGI